SPEVGDVAFIDTDLDGRADVTAIVVSIGDTITVIQGNYAVSDTESGETIDTVALVEYALDETILGYADVDYTEEVEDEEVVIDDEEPEILDAEELDVSAEDFATLKFVGTDYIITVSYGEDAALPEGTELVAYEYAQDSENFLARYAEAAELYGWGDSDETDPYHGFRLFNIGLYYDGIEIEPAAAVTVTVTYTGETDATSVSVTHFGDTATETLDATLDQGTDSQSVTFTADGFSEYGIMLTSLAANGEQTALFSDLTDTQLASLQVEIRNTIATDGNLEAVLYYVDDDNKNVYIVNSDNDYYIESYTDGDVTYTVTYTWYRSKEPYLTHLTDSGAYLEDAPESITVSSTSNYNYIISSSGNLGATVNGDNTCTVGRYVFYYYYVEVVIDGTTYACDPAYASVDGAACYVKIEKSSDGKTLTAVLYDENGIEYTNMNSNITYTYTWYKSRTYEATEGTSVTDAPYANTIADTYDYVQVGASASLNLSDDDSFYFYYVTVRLNYNPPEDDLTTTYNATAKGYEDWVYAGYINTSSSCTAVIVDNISSNGTFDAVLYDAEGKIVDTSSGYTFTWYKSDSEYLITDSTTIYSDLYGQNNKDNISCAKVDNATTSSTINVVEDSGGLHYYYVVIKDSSGNEYKSAVKYVKYSDQIENGGFENSTGVHDGYENPYWSTTNGYYSENHGSYNGYRKIELGIYGNSTALGTYAIAYSYGGGDSTSNKNFVELNATEASTLYQSVLTTPGTTLSWSVYHQNRSASNFTVTDIDTTTTSLGTLTTRTGTGTDSMYVIIMSDADAEKLLADVDENNENYDEQQEVIDAVAAVILAGTPDPDNGSASNGENSGCYEGDYTLKNSDETVHVTLWEVTTTKTVTRVILTDDSGAQIDASSLADDYPTSEGWAPYTATVNGTTTTVGYYKVSEWVKYSGSYKVPDGQYLTRFFFAAADAQGGNSNGNFIDTVEFSTDISYTIDYYIWDPVRRTYDHQDDSTYTEKGIVAYNATSKTVSASNLSAFTNLGYTQVGSVTSTVTGGTNPTLESGSEKVISLDVTLNTSYLSIYLASSDVALKKVDSTTGSVLEDVQFVMYKVDGSDKYYYDGSTWSNANEIAYLYTSTTGMIDFGSLADGTYYIVETKPLDGYNTTTGIITVTVSGGAVTKIEFTVDSSLISYALVGSETVITLKNTPGVELPETGGVSLPVAYAVGSLMILASAIGLVVRRKKI
ncbi:MAG: LPXTG cell wall anchor domain-containing protein, partial [Oscillospiraceae bacterium]|nr:LPXTG cell wall anchor domain-containing protein [Oscillospiraceae bacterium]